MTKQFKKRWAMNRDGWSFISSISTQSHVKVFARSKKNVWLLYDEYSFLTEGSEKNIKIFELLLDGKDLHENC